jgi:23S rRNA pseudouridine1911/1915/1917 synthase
MQGHHDPARSFHDPRLRVLYEDNHLFGVYKPGGWLVQGDRTGDVTLLDIAKEYLKKKYEKPGKVFLGLVHRIDRPVSGVVLFARTSKAASRLATEFRLRRVQKTYLAVVRGYVSEASGELAGYIERVHLRSRMALGPTDRAKEARLTWRRVAKKKGMSLLEIQPSTGRHHQIRLQLADSGHSVVGDLKYGAPTPLDDKTIALHAVRLIVNHPVRDETVTLEAAPPDSYPWSMFGNVDI